MEETKAEKNYNRKTKTRETSREIHDKRTESRKEFLNIPLEDPRNKIKENKTKKDR